MYGNEKIKEFAGISVISVINDLKLSYVFNQQTTVSSYKNFMINTTLFVCFFTNLAIELQ